MAQDEEKNEIMTRIAIDDESWEAFKELVKPMNVKDALGTMIKTSLEAETTPMSKVIENLLKDLMKGKKKGSPS